MVVSPTTHSGKPYSAKAVIAWTISSAARPSIPCRAMPARSFVSISAMRRSLRLKPNARRSSSASVPLKPAATIAMRSSCSWKSGTPSVRDRIGSRLGCG